MHYNWGWQVGCLGYFVNFQINKKSTKTFQWKNITKLSLVEKLSKGMQVMKDFEKKIPQKNHFCRVLLLYLRKNIKSQVVVPKRKRRDHSYSRKYKHEIAKELSQTIWIPNWMVLSVCIWNDKYKIALQCYLKFQLDDFCCQELWFSFQQVILKSNM